MVLKNYKVSEGGGSYYLEDLDLQSMQPEARPYWFGSGARRLGLLDRPFESKDFLKALAGINPLTKEEMRRRYRGARMIQRDGKGKLLNATAAWDFTFSPFKDFSTLWAIAPGMLQQVLVRLHHAAIQHTLQGLEQEVGYTRKGKGGTSVKRVTCLWAVFPHFTSRALDPQLHHHVLLVNWGILPDGSGGAIHASPWFRKDGELTRKWNQVYTEALVEGLSQWLGATVTPQRDDQGWITDVSIEGIPPALSAFFSKRSEQLRAEAGQNPSPAQLQRAVMTTRPPKTQDYYFSEQQFTQFRATAKQEFGAIWDQVVTRIQFVRLSMAPTLPDFTPVDLSRFTSPAPSELEAVPQEAVPSGPADPAVLLPMLRPKAELPCLLPTAQASLSRNRSLVTMQGDAHDQYTTFENLTNGRAHWLEAHRAERTVAQEQASLQRDQLFQQSRAGIHQQFELFRHHGINIRLFAEPAIPNPERSGPQPLGRIRISVDQHLPDGPVPSDPPLPKLETQAQAQASPRASAETQQAQDFAFYSNWEPPQGQAQDQSQGETQGQKPSDRAHNKTEEPVHQAQAETKSEKEERQAKTQQATSGATAQAEPAQDSKAQEQGPAQGQSPTEAKSQDQPAAAVQGPSQGASAAPTAPATPATAHSVGKVVTPMLQSVSGASRMVYNGVCESINLLRERRVALSQRTRSLSRIGVELAYATHRISMSDKIRCYRERGWDQLNPDKPVHSFPKSRLLIELQALTGYIKAEDRLYLLKRQLEQPQQRLQQAQEQAQQANNQAQEVKNQAQEAQEQVKEQAAQTQQEAVAADPKEQSQSQGESKSQSQTQTAKPKTQSQGHSC